jgi:NDP-sugar pyrophosphorylase family protein
MAAGIGRRFGSPKQVEAIGPSGETILDYSVFDALAAGFQKVVFVLCREIEGEFRKRVEATIGLACEVEYAIQELGPLPLDLSASPARRKPWGTAHAVMVCRDHVRTPFGVINADDFYGSEPFARLSGFLKDAQDHAAELDICMVGFPLENTLTEHGAVARGVCVVGSDGYLVEVQEQTRIERRGRQAGYLNDREEWVAIPAGRLASMNMWGFTPLFFVELGLGFKAFLQMGMPHLVEGEYRLPDVVHQLLAQGRAKVKVLPSTAQWLGITYREDITGVKEHITALVDMGEYPGRLWG